MKKIIIIIVLLSGFSNSKAQLRKIPIVVTESFKANYPKAEKVSWRDRLSNFEAAFTLKSHEYEVRFDSKGTVVLVEKKLTFDELPEEVKEGFRKSLYTAWEIRGVKEMIGENKIVNYRILVKKNTFQRKYLYFNEHGQMQKEGLVL